MCIARGQGLEEGLAPWGATLQFDSADRRPVWTLTNVLSSDPGGCSESGELIQVDTLTGAASARSEWSSIC
jgi:hypothetical protein